jgi:hypothetical protein
LHLFKLFIHQKKSSIGSLCDNSASLLLKEDVYSMTLKAEQLRVICSMPEQDPGIGCASPVTEMVIGIDCHLN